MPGNPSWCIGGKNHLSLGFVLTFFEKLQPFCKAPLVANPYSCHMFPFKFPFTLGIWRLFSRVVSDLPPIRQDSQYTERPLLGLLLLFLWRPALSAQESLLHTGCTTTSGKLSNLSLIITAVGFLKGNCKKPFQNKTCYSEDFKCFQV